jgi:hypothetical protein
MGPVCFSTFQKGTGHRICLAVNKSNPFQTLVFEESVSKRCILECHSVKFTVFKRAVLQRAIKNCIVKLCGIKGGAIPHCTCHYIFQQCTEFDSRSRKIGTGKITAFNLVF